ncbi:MAG: hypothetical protein OEV17_04135, partial [Nitrospira sp.]|nr:hypothetical protein [Nitrospira sp.]
MKSLLHVHCDLHRLVHPFHPAVHASLIDELTVLSTVEGRDTSDEESTSVQPHLPACSKRTTRL